MARLPVVKGTLDLLVLRALSWTPMHGFEIVSWLERAAGGALDVEDSALYQAVRLAPSVAAPVVPARAAYSHSASVGNRYWCPVIVDNLRQNSFACSQVTLSTGRSSPLKASLRCAPDMRRN